MCKIMVMPGITPEKLEMAWNFAHKAQPMMQADRDTDGFGYAGITPAGTIFGERWLDKKDAFVNRFEPGEQEALDLDAFKGALHRPVEYNSFGDIGESVNVSSMILHARLATCEKSLFNTHPFVRDGFAFIHNGVVDRKNLDFKMSTCDSEGILNAYLDAKVNENPANIQTVANRIKGTYACALVGVAPDGTPYVDVFKESYTNLLVARIQPLNILVFSTTAEIINRTMAAMNSDNDMKKYGKFSCDYSFYLKGGYLIRMNAITGAIMHVERFSTDSTSGGGTTKDTDGWENWETRWNGTTHSHTQKGGGTIPNVIDYLKRSPKNENA